MRSFCEENFVNFNTVRDISSLRQDFQAALAEIGLIDPPGRGPRRNQDLDDWNVNSENESLLKGILVGAFWPRIVRIRLPDAKFEKVQAGSVAKEHEAREVKYYDSVDNSRVFIVSYCRDLGTAILPLIGFLRQHPGSILFHENNLKPGYITFFHRAETSKVFLFDATPVSLPCCIRHTKSKADDNPSYSGTALCSALVWRSTDY
jgi:ATP-dependent RNA helicase DHX57